MTRRLLVLPAPATMRRMSTPDHDPASDASRLRAALDTLGWTQRYLAWRTFSHEASIAAMCRNKQRAPPRLIEWLEAAAAHLKAHPLPDGWENGRDEEPRTGPFSPR